MMLENGVGIDRVCLAWSSGWIAEGSGLDEGVNVGT